MSAIVERKNGTLQQWCKRLTRLTCAFSKKWDNLKAALAVNFAHCNFCRVHGSLRITPAMPAGITDHVWNLEDLIECLNTPWHDLTDKARKGSRALFAAPKRLEGKLKNRQGISTSDAKAIWAVADSPGDAA